MAGLAGAAAFARSRSYNASSRGELSKTCRVFAKLYVAHIGEQKRAVTAGHADGNFVGIS